jgi:Flp pilus assembly pilin Flp
VKVLVGVMVGVIVGVFVAVLVGVFVGVQTAAEAFWQGSTPVLLSAAPPVLVDSPTRLFCQ